MNTQKQIYLIVVLFAILVGGCAAYTAIDLPIRAERQADYFEAESIERGALLFANNCRTCHGIKGEGSVGLPLNKKEFQNQDPLVLKANRDLITRTLYCGRAGTLMPAWLNTNGGSLNQRQIAHLVDLITAPATGEDAEGLPTNDGWEHAVEFAHNLNEEASAVIGGDTLDTIATAHRVGYRELAAANNLDVNATVKKGTTVKLPDGRTFKVARDNQTIEKIANEQHVGAVIIAGLNNIRYRIDAETGAFTILNEQGQPVPGLLPGQQLALPEGGAYIVRPGDKLQTVAERHNLSASAIQSLNSAALSGLSTSDEIPSQRTLKLPSNAVVIVVAGQSVALLAQQHGITVDELAKVNQGLTATTVLDAGARLNLPSGAEYVIQQGDTLDKAASAHGTTKEELAALNNIAATDAVSPAVILQLPKVDRYVVDGQSLEEVAKGYGNVTAESLGEVNGLAADAVVPIGTTLRIPEDSFGTAPPDAKNPGTACVQFAVPKKVFDESIIGTPRPVPTPPATVSSSVRVEAHANDWTVIADGQTLPANNGVALVRSGTTIQFTSVSGLHSVDVNGVNGDDIADGASLAVTFSQPGLNQVTCTYHADMYAAIFVQ